MNQIDKTFWPASLADLTLPYLDASRLLRSAANRPMGIWFSVHQRNCQPRFVPNRQCTQRHRVSNDTSAYRH
jgi:hypothetical protein